MICDITRIPRVSIAYFFSNPLPLPPPPAAQGVPVFGMYAATKRETRVRWYEATPGAKTLPFQSFMQVADWFDDWERCEMEFGEVPFQTIHRDTRPAPIGATGQFACGQESDFTTPKVWSGDLPTLMRGASGLPVCCNPTLAAAFAMFGPDPDMPAVVLQGLAIADTGIVLQPASGGIVIAESSLGLNGEVQGIASGSVGLMGGSAAPVTYNCAICSMELFSDPLLITLSAPAYPQFHGLVLPLTNDLNGDNCQWTINDFPARDGGLISMQFTAQTLPILFVFWNWSYIPPVGNQLDSSGGQTTGYTCNPFTYSETEPIIDSVSGPTGNNLTISVTD